MQNNHTFPLAARIFHWLIAACVIVNLWISEPETYVHEYMGIAIAILIVLRIVAIVKIGGPKLTFNPKVMTTHIKEIINKEQINTRYTPLGALMIWVLWSLTLATAITGYFGYHYEWAESLTDVHEVFASILQIFVVVHISVIFFLSWWTKTNLPKRMVHD